MTSTRTTTATGKGGCGCAADAEPESCGLECIEKPRFSCGQLLTDQDLTALVGWSEKKASLARYRHGWGVVCGLDVYCDGHDGEVSLGPGYAVDCCGRDIVVCGATTVSLDACCKAEPDPCAAVTARPAVAETVDFGTMKVENVRAVDLVLRYAEEGGSPRPTLGRSNCRDTGACEYSRIKETSRVVCSIGTSDMDAVEAQAGQWEKQYSKCLDVLDRYQNECGKAKGGDIQRWLMRWLERNPLHQLCFVKDWICEPAAGSME